MSHPNDPLHEPAHAEPAAPVTDDVVRVLVDNHRAFLAFLERRVGRRDVAEDILQEAFARGLDRVETLREGDSVVAWFYRALRNAVVDHHRRRGASQRALEGLARELDEASAPEAELRANVCQCVTRLATTLKPEYADALQRIEVDGLSVKDFAAERGISSSNAAVRVFRAREALRRQLAASCGTCAEHGCLDCTCAPVESAAGEHAHHDGCCGGAKH